MNIEQQAFVNESLRFHVMPLVKVLIAHESRFMGDIFTEILDDEPDITVVGQAATPEAAVINKSIQ